MLDSVGESLQHTRPDDWGGRHADRRTGSRTLRSLGVLWWCDWLVGQAFAHRSGDARYDARACDPRADGGGAGLLCTSRARARATVRTLGTCDGPRLSARFRLAMDARPRCLPR